METAIELMQLYTDRREYEKAAFWMQKSEQIQKDSQGVINDLQHNLFGNIYIDHQIFYSTVWSLYVSADCDIPIQMRI